MKWESPRGTISIDPRTRDIVQNIYIRKVQKVEVRDVPRGEGSAQGSGGELGGGLELGSVLDSGREVNDEFGSRFKSVDFERAAKLLHSRHDDLHSQGRGFFLYLEVGRKSLPTIRNTKIDTTILHMFQCDLDRSGCASRICMLKRICY